jgi:hypothetical protein
MRIVQPTNAVLVAMDRKGRGEEERISQRYFAGSTKSEGGPNMEQTAEIQIFKELRQQGPSLHCSEDGGANCKLLPWAQNPKP